MIAKHVMDAVDDDHAVSSSNDCLAASMDLCVIPFNRVQTVLNGTRPSENGADVPNAVPVNGFDLTIIFVSKHDDVPTAMRALRAGAVDLMEKPYNQQMLLNSIQQALSCSSKVDYQNRLQTVLQRMADLTPRERDVLLPLVQGYTSREMAEQLGISVKTVDLYRSRVMRHMQAQTLPELVGMAIAAGLVDPLALRGVADAAND